MLAINIRWLDKDFRRHQHCIEFIEIQGSHSGENLASVVLTALKRHDMCHLLLTITGDNASNNDTLCVNLHELLLREYDDYLEEFPDRNATMRFRREASRIRCFAHVLNLIVKAILAELGSSTYKQATEYLDRVSEAIAKRKERQLDLPGAQGVVAKLRIIVLWIIRSPYRIQEWKKRDNTPKIINYDVDTRWNFTLRMIDDAFDCRSAINDSCDDIDALKDMKLRPEEWNQLDKIREILRPFRKFTEYCSREQPSIQMLARMYNEVGLLLRRISQKQGPFSTIDSTLVSAVKKGIEVFEKYYSYIGEHDLYYIATVLDPRIKTKWIEENCENPSKVIDRIQAFLKATYPLPDSELPSNTIDDVFQSLEYQFVAPFLDRSTEEAIEHDIDTYINTPRVKYHGTKTEDQSQWILSWWNANKSQFPCMALAAREFLAIPASEVDCERIFSEARDLLGVRRYAMNGETMRTMMLLKGALRSKRLIEEAEKPTIKDPHASHMPQRRNQ